MAKSFWQSKPWWCQPWSIMVTGLGITAGGWWLSQRWWVVVVLSIPVLAWWLLFLVLVPRAVHQGGGDGLKDLEDLEDLEIG